MESGDPFRLIDVLSKHNVPFVIIGGHAVTYHGYVRATEDTDIVIQRVPDSDRALLAALSEVNAQWISDEIDPATGIERTFPVSLGYIQASRLMMLVTDYGFLDIFDFIPGLPDEPVDQLFRSAVASHGRCFASIVHVRRNPRSSPSGRPRRGRRDWGQGRNPPKCHPFANVSLYDPTSARI